jgi:hypothetical protein
MNLRVLQNPGKLPSGYTTDELSSMISPIELVSFKNVIFKISNLLILLKVKLGLGLNFIKFRGQIHTISNVKLPVL